MNSEEDRSLGIKKWLTGPGRKGAVVTEKRPELSTRDRRRIAVLPFANMSPDPNDSYLADGITEEVISTLSGVSELSVISRTSVIGYRGSTKR